MPDADQIRAALVALVESQHGHSEAGDLLADHLVDLILDQGAEAHRLLRVVLQTQAAFTASAVSVLTPDERRRFLDTLRRPPPVGNATA